jgi:hypothetical protein
MNSSREISPSLSRSNSSIIACSSSSDRFSPSSRAIRFIFFRVIFPDLSSSNKANAFRISSSGSLSKYLVVTTGLSTSMKYPLSSSWTYLFQEIGHSLLTRHSMDQHLQRYIILLNQYCRSLSNVNKLVPCTSLTTSGFFTSNPSARIRTFSSCRSI